MKIIIIYIVFIILIINNAKAESDIGLSVGPVLKPSLIDNTLLWMTGSRIGVTFNQKYYLGISLYGSTFDSYQPLVEDANYIIYPEMNINFISLETEYNISPNDEIFLSLSLNNGVSLSKFDIPYLEDPEGNLYNPPYKENVINYFVEPGISLNLNFKAFYKINIGLSYRYVFINNTAITNLIKDNTQFFLDNSYLNGINLNFAIRFGGF